MEYTIVIAEKLLKMVYILCVLRKYMIMTINLDVESLKNNNESVKNHYATGFRDVAKALEDKGALKYELISAHLQKNKIEGDNDDSLRKLAKVTDVLFWNASVVKYDDLLVSYKLLRFLNIYARMDDNARAQIFGDDHSRFTKLIEDFSNDTLFKEKFEKAIDMIHLEDPNNATLLNKYTAIMRSFARGGLDQVKNPQQPAPQRVTIPVIHNARKRRRPKKDASRKKRREYLCKVRKDAQRRRNWLQKRKQELENPPGPPTSRISRIVGMFKKS